MITGLAWGVAAFLVIFAVGWVWLAWRDARLVRQAELESERLLARAALMSQDEGD